MTRCWCGASIVNGHHCERGHVQTRDVDLQSRWLAELSAFLLGIAAGGALLIAIDHFSGGSCFA